MDFKIENTIWDHGFELLYRPADYSFDVVPRPSGAISSVLVNDLELEVNDEGIVLCATGLCPHTGWERTTHGPPDATRRTLRVEASDGWVPGISKRLTSPSAWRMFVNQTAGSVCVGNPEARTEGVEFAPGCVAVLEDKRLVALWLRPKELP